MPESSPQALERKPSPRKRYIRWGLEALVLGLAFWALHAYQTRGTASGPAPALEAVDINGQAVSLAALRGQPVLVHFWASWCPVCRAEEGNIIAIAERNAVLSVALEDSETLQAYVKKEKLNFPVVADAEGQWATAYGVRGVPASFIIDPAGQIRFTTVGYTTQWGLRFRLWLAANTGNGSTVARTD